MINAYSCTHNFLPFSIYVGLFFLLRLLQFSRLVVWLYSHQSLYVTTVSEHSDLYSFSDEIAHLHSLLHSIDLWRSHKTHVLIKKISKKKGKKRAPPLPLFKGLLSLFFSLDSRSSFVLHHHPQKSAHPKPLPPPFVCV